MVLGSSRQTQASNSLRKYSTTFRSSRRPRTIFALSTPFGVSGICVIRVSGPSARLVLDQMTRSGKHGEKSIAIPDHRLASLRTVIVPNNPIQFGGTRNTELLPGEVIDEGIVVFYEKGKSYTGEDMVELQLHGSVSVIRDTLQALSMLSEDMVEAEPGEFTRRAWANGRLEGDLTRLEAVADLIHAETRTQRKQAFNQLQGELGDLYNAWTKEIYTCLAHMEALVDFGHDELLEDSMISKNIKPKVNSLISKLESHLNDNGRGQLLRNGITVALVGPPNAGKSSLMNLLAQRAFSIVSEEAGTTRDVVEAKIDLSGFPLILQDTAGLNPSASIGKIELEGISRAKQRFNFSSIKLVVIDVNDQSHFHDNNLHNLIRENPSSTIFVLNKVDTKQELMSGAQAIIDPNFIDGKPMWIAKDPLFSSLPSVYISCTSGFGVDGLKTELKRTIENSFGAGLSSVEGPVITRQRHRDNLQEALEALLRFNECPIEHFEILAEELRLAGRAISRITGKVDVEQILEIVFKDFCIGK